MINDASHVMITKYEQVFSRLMNDNALCIRKQRAILNLSV